MIVNRLSLVLETIPNNAGVLLRYRAQNTGTRTLYLANQFSDRPSYAPTPSRLEFAKSFGYTTLHAPHSVVVRQGDLMNADPQNGRFAPKFQLPNPFFSALAPGETTSVDIPLPLPLVEWDWWSTSYWPDADLAPVSIDRLVFELEVCEPIEAPKELDGFPGVFQPPDALPWLVRREVALPTGTMLMARDVNQPRFERSPTNEIDGPAL